MIIKIIRRKYYLFFFLSLFALVISSYSSVANAFDAQLLTTPWHLTGNNSGSESYQKVNSNILNGQNKIRITYNLHGLCALGGDASAIIFDQGNWKFISLSKYGKNCLDGNQTIEVTLSDFKDTKGNSLSTTSPLTGNLHTRFWYDKTFTVDISNVTVFNSSIKTSSMLVPTISPTPTSTPLPTVGTTTSPISQLSGTTQLLTSSWNLSGNNGSSEKYQTLNSTILQDKTNLTLNYDLHGLCALGGDASAIIFVQGGSWHYVSLSKYGQNCKNGPQTVTIPLSDFLGLNLFSKVDSFQSRFWYNGTFNVDITSAILSSSSFTAISPTPATSITNTPTPTPIAIIPPTNTKSWPIKSIDAMKETKDVICSQRSEIWINQFVTKAVELGANYIAISTPYENPSCGDARAYTKTWIKAIRAKGLKVWFRQMPLAFEGIYSVSKNNSSDFLSFISNYIKTNPDNYQDGDIFTSIPEPQNGGISGITYCANSVCQFQNAAAFNQWLRKAMTTAEQAFASIGKNNMKIGYFGFDGFVAWGDNNPDWNGILEDATVQQMGNITIDHYPELIGSNMSQDLSELTARYPGVDIIIGEWGTVTGVNPEQQVRNSMGAAAVNLNVKGFNYWHMGMGGSGEQLINDDFSNRSQFDEVQSFYK